jgi:hypothetical protein
MSETLLQFAERVIGPDGREYEARACGGPLPGGMWQGWVEFIPIADGEPVRSGRETTQPNRTDTVYWASGLSAVYLEGALRRALATPSQVPVVPTQPSVFASPAPAVSPPIAVEPSSVLDPFSVYQKGEALLRKQLGALSAWHLVNIVRAYELSDEDARALNRMSAPALIELIVTGVRTELRQNRGTVR